MDTRDHLLVETNKISSGSSAKRRAIPARSWLTVVMCAMYTIFYLDRVNISQSASYIQKEFGLTNTALGIVFSAFAWSYLAGQFTGGWFAYRFGARRVLTICAVLVAAGTISSGLVGGVVALFAARLVVGIGEGPAFPTATHAMRSWYPPRLFGWIQGITHSFARFGGAVAPPFVAWLILVDGWRLSFYVCGLLSLTWGIVWLTFFRDDPRDHPNLTESEANELELPKQKMSKGGTPFLALVKRIWPATVVEFCYGWTLWVFSSWLPLYFMNHYNQDLKRSALFSGLLIAGGMVGDTVGGLVTDRLLVRTGNRRLARCGVMFVGMFLGGCFMLPTLFISDLFWAVPLLALSFFCVELVVAPMWSVCMDITPEYAGIATSMMTLGFGLSGIVSPIAFGMLIDRTGNWNVPFLTAVVILFIGAALVWFIRPDQQLKVKSQD